MVVRGFITRNNIRAPVGVSIVLRVVNPQTKVPVQFPGASSLRTTMYFIVLKKEAPPGCSKCRFTELVGQLLTEII